MASNKTMVPEAKAAMEQFKMQAASEVGVNLQNGYNGDLTARQAGSIGDQMVKKIKPTRTLTFEHLRRHDRCRNRSFWALPRMGIFPRFSHS